MTGVGVRAYRGGVGKDVAKLAERVRELGVQIAALRPLQRGRSREQLARALEVVGVVADHAHLVEDARRPGRGLVVIAQRPRVLERGHRLGVARELAVRVGGHVRTNPSGRDVAALLAAATTEGGAADVGPGTGPGAQ